MNQTLLFLLLLSISITHCTNKTLGADTSIPPPPPPPPQGKSFFLFGAIFRKFRQRWAAHHDPGLPGGPLFAGPTFPVYGYQNCPTYGCNPALTYRPAPYEPTNIYYQQPAAYQPNTVYGAPPPPPPPQLPPQQQQQQQQQSNVVIYHDAPQQHGYYAQHMPPGAALPPPPSSSLPLPPPQTYQPAQHIPSYGHPNMGPTVIGAGNGMLPVGGAQYPTYPVHAYGNYAPTAPALGPAYPANPGYVPMPPQQSPAGYAPPIGTAMAVGTTFAAPAPGPCNAQMHPCNVGK